MKENHPWVYLIQSHNFVDFNAFDDDEPLKHSATVVSLTWGIIGKVVEVTGDLLLHETSFVDELIDPFGQSQNTENYVSSSSNTIDVYDYLETS